MEALSPGVDERVKENFWLYVRKTDSCWLWAGPNNGRYGRVGRRTYAHRLSYEIANGPIPYGMQVLHKCDVPLCVRPSHLFLGTQKDNMNDAANKGRLATGDEHPMRAKPWIRATGARHGSKTQPWSVSRGEDRPASKLTEEQVRQIRWLSDLGESRAVLARRFGVTTTVIRRIAMRESWRHVQ